MMEQLDEAKMYTLAILAVVLAAIVGLSIYHISDRTLMSTNIDSAIAKGINPMSVRCSYVRGDDPICIAYAAKNADDNKEVVTSSKK